MGTHPSPKRGRSPSPQFSAHFYCGQTAGCIKVPLGMEVGLSPGDFVFDGDAAPSPQKGSPQFSVHVYCGQTAGWIKMALGTEVGLGPGHIELDEDPASPNFGPFLLLSNGWIHQDDIWHGGRPQPKRLCVRWGPSPFFKRGGALQFSAHVYCGQTAAWICHLVRGRPRPTRHCVRWGSSSMSVVAKRLDGLRWHLVWR